MDALYDIINSEAFKIGGPIVIGIVASWYISKHFFNKKKISGVKLALKTKEADFGDYYNISQEKIIRAIETTHFGTWHIKSDGTVTDTKNKLSWIRAPWGTEWNGETFEGKPIGMRWRTATTLFGKGVYKEYYKHADKVHVIDVNPKNYKKGSCKVTFAGASDWRLPSSEELETLHDKPFSNSYVDFVKAYSAELKALKAELFPGFKSNPNNYNVWSADEAGSNCAWMSSQLYSASDQQFHEEHYVLFVRTVNNYAIEQESKLLASS